MYVESKWGEARYRGDTSRDCPGVFNVDSDITGREREGEMVVERGDIYYVNETIQLR